MKNLTEEMKAALPSGRKVVVATTNGMYTWVYMDNGEVWEYKGPCFEQIGEYELPIFDDTNIRDLGFPYGLRAWGHALSRKVGFGDYGLMELTNSETTPGETRVRFTLSQDWVIAPSWRNPLVVKKGVYDYIIESPQPQDWSGWFND